MNNTRLPLVPLHSQQGFVLVLTLWAVVIVLLLGAALDTYVSRRVQQAQFIRDRVQGEVDLYSTRETVLYLLGTQRYTRAGLTTETIDQDGEADTDTTTGGLRIDPVGGEIALDGTDYRGIGGVRFEMQDTTGLIALNSDSEESLRGLLQGFTLDPVQLSTLIDTLADYRDDNALRRLNGAEKEEYAAQGMHPPANTNLLSVAELTQVWSWRDWLLEHRDFRLHEWLSVSRIAAFNPNVAPEGLLARLPGMDSAQARLIVDLRRAEPFRSLPDMLARSDVEIAGSEDEYRFFPSDMLLLAIWRDGAPRAETLALQLTPLGQNGPWQISSSYQVSHVQQDQAQHVASFLFGTGTSPQR